MLIVVWWGVFWFLFIYSKYFKMIVYCDIVTDINANHNTYIIYKVDDIEGKGNFVC